MSQGKEARRNWSAGSTGDVGRRKGAAAGVCCSTGDEPEGLGLGTERAECCRQALYCVFLRFILCLFLTHISHFVFPVKQICYTFLDHSFSGYWYFFNSQKKLFPWLL